MKTMTLYAAIAALTAAGTAFAFFPGDQPLPEEREARPPCALLVEWNPRSTLAASATAAHVEAASKRCSDTEIRALLTVLENAIANRQQ